MKYFHSPYHRSTPQPGTYPPIANATLMPASLLPFSATYRRIANTLPTGSILILTPTLVLSKQRSTLVKVAEFLRSNGHQVTTLPFS